MTPAGASRRTVEVAVDGFPAPRWRGRLRRFCVQALREAGAGEWELSFLLCDDGRITALNERYRHRKGPTDVLSFPREASAMEGVIAGDIAISLETLRRNARRFGVTEDEELKRLVVHGILHCAGMDHGAGKGKRMLSLQERLLEALKLERIIGT